MIERPLEGFALGSRSSLRDGATSLALVNKDGVRFACSLVAPNMLHTTLTGPGLPLPPSRTVARKARQALPLHFLLGDGDRKAADSAAVSSSLSPTSATFSTGPDAPIVVRVAWTDAPVVEIFWRQKGPTDIESDSKTDPVPAFSDLPFRSYSRSEHGMIRYTAFDEDCIHLGLGERAAPLDLTKRSFVIAGSDSASYDAYLSDPLYKHTPFLLSTPRPSSSSGNGHPRPSTGILSASNSDAQWDVARFIDEPWKMFKRSVQDWGGLDEYIIVDRDPASVVKQFGRLVGRPRLVPRQWLGYLASGMGLGESDDPPAQQLLEGWPETCRKHGIPCSAMHLSSGYTVDEATGTRNVFTMNKRRYPDFAQMVRSLQRAGIATAPNVKPYVLTSHPDFDKLRKAGALFRDPATGEAVITRIWASSIGVNGKGSWIDMTSKAGRAWWRQGIAGLVALGVDAIWNDNNEYSLHDDEFLCAAEFSDEEGEGEGDDDRDDVSLSAGRSYRNRLGLVGRMRNTHEMARVSAEALRETRQDKRALVLTRSANISTMQHAASSWSGDNRTSWTTLRGSVAMALNAQMSLLSSYGTDVGGFAGPQPSPQLLARWIQLGVTHPRFCIHSYKPTEKDPSGRSTTTTPWMYPEIAPAIRAAICRRYELLPFWNDLQWRAHNDAEPCNTPLFWGPFAADVRLYSLSGRAIQDGERDGQGYSARDESLDYWIGTGRILACSQFFQDCWERDVYLPRTSPKDEVVYYNLHAPYGHHAAGQTVRVKTPIEHGALFARQGTVLPVGKPCVTVVTAAALGDGEAAVPARPLLDSEGGVVALDDWRGIEIFPPPPGQGTWAHTDQWIEDDGVSEASLRAVVSISFSSMALEDASRTSNKTADSDDSYVMASAESAEEADMDGEGSMNGCDEVICVQARFIECDFRPMWGNRLHVILPHGDTRPIRGAERSTTPQGRLSWSIEVGSGQ